VNPSLVAALVRLRLTRVFRERINLIWLFVMPMVFSFLMGQMLGDWSGGGQDSRPRFMVYDRDGGQAVDSLLAPLLDNERFITVRVDTLVAEEDIKASLAKHRITAALFVPEGFTRALASNEETVLRLYYDSDRLSSQTVRTLLDRAILKLGTLQVVKQLAGSAGAPGTAALSAHRFESLWANPRVTVSVATLGRKTEAGLALDRSAQHVGPAYTIFFIMMFLLTSSKELVAERQDRTLARLMVSRASSLDLVMGLFLGGMVLGLLQAAVLLGLNMLPPFGVDYGDSPAGLFLVVVLFVAFSSAASLLLGSLARSGAQADGLGMAFTMVMAALGGLWWPLEIVPEFMQKLGHALPTGQAISVFHDMIGRGFGVAEMSAWLLGLGCWFLLTMALAVWQFRKLAAA